MRYQNGDVAVEYSHKYTCALMPNIQPNVIYDAAISFLTPHYFVAKKVNANRKIAWIHTDYSNVKINIPSETKMWSVYDKIVSISEAVSESFVKIFPKLEDKLVLVENILPEKLVRRQADKIDISCEMPNDESLKLLSIGRFCNAKNFDNIPDICAMLLKKGYNIRWYIIGFGKDETLIRNKIQEADLENRVILLGKKDNPYPYIKACDIYIQPSRYEGKSVTVREAQMLEKPVIITNYSTAISQLEDGKDGVIVPLDNKGCADGIAKVIENQNLRYILVGNCRKRDYSNIQEINKLYALIDGEE